jgi:molybdate transport system substrate-binding protein
MRSAGRFEKANPDVDVPLQYAGSQSLAAQIEQRAPKPDVFASAAER